MSGVKRPLPGDIAALKIRVCLRCRKEFLSNGYRRCEECHRVTANVSKQASQPGATRRNGRRGKIGY